MACWLLKTEPTDYAFADLQRDGQASWTGVKNAAAQIHLRTMKAGDAVLIYHTGSEKAVVATARVTRAAYPDPGDPDGKRVAVEIAAGEPLPRPVTLAEIKADGRFKQWGLVKMGRLSVVPTSREVFDAIRKMAGAGK